MAAQYGPHRWPAGYHDTGNNDAFRGATFMAGDLAGAIYPEESRSVGECLGVVMEEECEHHRFAIRDLVMLEAR